MPDRRLDEEEIFHVARKITDPETQAKYLDQICAGDQRLRERVEALLKVHEQPEGFLAPEAEPGATADQPSIAEMPGHEIGRYKLLQQIGEGGFGVVYMAEQQQPVHRKVALKLIKPGMDTRAVVARFEAERQALALMDHPNIARVFDGGATESGRPYFVMELVKGVPITEYCDKNQLTTEERLKLIITVCQAVQHAHQKGVIHRDLKPSNIMVTLHDGKPVPKVIDFGVSKAINQRLTEKTLFTNYGQMIGTPQYMSPEQAELSGLDIDTRSDVYSLGVLLYELLTGTTPLESDRLLAAGYAEIQRIIREEDPPKPSVRLSTLGERLTVIAQHRSTDGTQLRRLIHGELDWIVMKSLEKERSRRYTSANSLAADMERFLAGEPVEAHPPSTTYRLRKFVRRNRVPVAAAVCLLTVLLLGIAGTTSGWIQATQAFRRETVERIAAERAGREKEEEARRANEAVRKEQKARSTLSMVAAFQAWDSGNFQRTQDLLRDCRVLEGANAAPSFAWRFLWQRCCQTYPTRTLKCGSGIPAASYANSEEFTSIVSSLDEKHLAVALRGGDVVLYDWQSFQETRLTIPQEQQTPWQTAQSVAFSPDGRYLLVGGGEIGSHGLAVVWDLSSQTPTVLPDEHKDIVDAVAISPDGKTAATLSVDGVLKVRAFPTGELRYPEIPDLPTNRNRVAFSPKLDERFLAVSATDSLGSILFFYDADSGQLIRALELPSEINMFAFSSDGNRMATACHNGVWLWNMEMSGPTIQDRLTPRRCDGVAFSFDDKYVAVRDRDTNEAVIWELEGRHEVSRLFDIGRSVLFSPVSCHFITGQNDIKLWDIMTWKARTYSGSEVALSPDGRTFAVERNGSVFMWDTETDHCIGQLKGCSAPITFAPDGRQLASGDETNAIRLWDIATGSSTILGAHDYPISALDFSPDGRKLASVAAVTKSWEDVHGDVRLWNVTTGEFTRLPGHEDGFVRSVKFSRTGRYLASSAGVWGGNGTDKTRIWLVEADTPRCVREFDSPARAMSIAFSPDERLIAIGGRGANEVTLWDIEENHPVTSFRVMTPWLCSMAFSADGRTLIGGCNSRDIKFWEVPTGEELGTLRLEQGASKVVLFPNHDNSLVSVSRDGAVRVWPVTSIVYVP